MKRVALLETGVANNASVRACLRRAGLSWRPAANADDVVSSDALLLPGVGAIGSMVTRIDELGLRSALVDRIESGRPTLCIYLGMQVLFEWSEEGDGVPGLGVAPGLVRRFPAGVLQPQLGWNRVRPRQAGLVKRGYAYFANSFRVDAVHELESSGWAVSLTPHGGYFVSSIERRGVLACQFHPELSGAWGADLIRRWACLNALLNTGVATCSPRA